MNRKNTWYLMVVLLIGLFALWGCPKKAEVTAIPEAQQGEAPTVEQGRPEQKEEAARSEDEEARERSAAAASGLQPVYFDFDRSFINVEAGEVMRANAEWLKAHAQARIKIEGNCDDRGTREYNQALGQRRAASAKKYLVDMGISAQRISLISYGKEKPGCTENTESCRQKNRRDDFSLLSD